MAPAQSPNLEDNIRRALIDHRKGFMKQVVEAEPRFQKALIYFASMHYPTVDDAGPDIVCLFRDLERTFFEAFQIGTPCNGRTDDVAVWQAYFQKNPSLPAEVKNRLESELLDRAYERECSNYFIEGQKFIKKLTLVKSWASAVSKLASELQAVAEENDMPSVATAMGMAQYSAAKMPPDKEQGQGWVILARNQQIVYKLLDFCRSKQCSVPPLPDSWPDLVKSFIPTKEYFLCCEVPEDGFMPAKGYMPEFRRERGKKEALFEEAINTLAEISWKTSQAQASWIYNTPQNPPNPQP